MTITRAGTRYGDVFRSSVCKDDFSNMITKTVKRRGKGGYSVRYTLQKPAVTSLRAVARELGGPFRQMPVKVTGTSRTCEYQAALYAKDPHRYASPNGTLHTQGLAIDVDMNFLAKFPQTKRLLLEHGWHQSRPDDEPWHFSFRFIA